MITRAFRRQWPSVLLSLVTGFMLAPFLVETGGQLYDRWFPVNRAWTVTHLWIDGRDIMVEGTMVKARACRYLPPVRARDDEGRHYRVESSSVTAKSSWSVSDKPQAFGPWRVVDAEGRRLTFYQEHQCTPLWVTFTELGTIDPP